MNSQIEVSSLDPRLVKVGTDGRISGFYFPNEITVRGVGTASDILEQSVGEITLHTTEPDKLDIYYSGNIIYFSSNFEKSLVTKVWAGNSYFNDFIDLISDNQFTVSSTGNSIVFSPNALHSINGLNGDLNFYAFGNTSIFTDSLQNNIELYINVLDDSNFSRSSDILSKEIYVSKGMLVNYRKFPSLVNLSDLDGVLSVIGPTGCVIQSGCLSNLYTDEIKFNSSSLKNREGSLYVESPSMGFAEGTHLVGALGLSSSVHELNFIPVSGDHFVATVPLANPILSVNIQIQNGFTQNLFSKVLGFNESSSIKIDSEELSKSCATYIADLLSNPSSLSGQEYVDYFTLVTGIAADNYQINHSSSTSGSLVGVIEPDLNYIVTGNVVNLYTSGILYNLTEAKASLYQNEELLARPKTAALFYDFDSTAFRVHLKNPSENQPTGVVAFFCSTL